MLTIERIEDVGRFATMAEEWNALLRDSDADCFFLTWEWLYTWWESLRWRWRRRSWAACCRAGLFSCSAQARWARTTST
jgi:hypothetical protein